MTGSFTDEDVGRAFKVGEADSFFFDSSFEGAMDGWMDRWRRGFWDGGVNFM